MGSVLCMPFCDLVSIFIAASAAGALIVAALMMPRHLERCGKIAMTRRWAPLASPSCACAASERGANVEVSCSEQRTRLYFALADDIYVAGSSHDPVTGDQTLEHCAPLKCSVCHLIEEMARKGFDCRAYTRWILRAVKSTYVQCRAPKGDMSTKPRAPVLLHPASAACCSQ